MNTSSRCPTSPGALAAAKFLYPSKRRALPVALTRGHQLRGGEKPADLMNRVIGANLGEITKDMKRQNTKLLFKVNSTKENRAVADIVGYNIMPSYLRRSVAKIKNRMK